MAEVENPDTDKVSTTNENRRRRVERTSGLPTGFAGIRRRCGNSRKSDCLPGSRYGWNGRRTETRDRWLERVGQWKVLVVLRTHYNRALVLVKGVMGTVAYSRQPFSVFSSDMD